MSMNIYSPPGCKLRFTNTGGHDFERERAAKILSTTAVYTLEWACVDSSRTDVKLVEVPGEDFNSVMFEEITAPQPPRQVVGEVVVEKAWNDKPMFRLRHALFAYEIYADEQFQIGDIVSIEVVLKERKVKG